MALFSPDGKLWPSEAESASPPLDTEHGQCTHQLNDAELPSLTGGCHSVASVMFAARRYAPWRSRGREQIASAARGAFRLWETATGKEYPGLKAVALPPLLSFRRRQVCRFLGPTELSAAVIGPCKSSSAPFPRRRDTWRCSLTTVERCPGTRTTPFSCTTPHVQELTNFKGPQSGVFCPGFRTGRQVLRFRGHGDNTIRLSDLHP